MYLCLEDLGPGVESQSCNEAALELHCTGTISILCSCVRACCDWPNTEVTIIFNKAKREY